MELLTLLLWLWTELESKNGFCIQRNVTLNSNQAPQYNYCRKRMTGLPFSEQLPLIPQADRAFKPGESCGPLSESSWCLWGEFGERNGFPLITNAGWTADLFSPALNPCLFCVEWGPPPSGSWTSGKSLQTFGQVEKVKRQRKHGGLYNTWLSHSCVLTGSCPALIRIDSPAGVWLLHLPNFSVISGSLQQSKHPVTNLPPLVVPTRLDEAAVALQKEKNMYKEIENFPMCFKVGPGGV